MHFSSSKLRKNLCVATISLSLFGVLHSQAKADTLPSLESSCMSYTIQDKHINAEHSEADDFLSTLTDMKVSLNAKKVHVRSSETLNENQFNSLNALAAYFIMTGYHMQLSSKCSGLPYKELSSVSLVPRDIHWEDVTLSRPGLDVYTKSFKISFAPDHDKIKMTINIDGITTSKKTVLPQRISATLELTPSNTIPYSLSIKDLTGDVAGSKFSGNGDVLAGEYLKTSKGHLHISIEHIGPVMREAAAALSAKTNTALLIARLMAQHEGNGSLGWDASLNDGQMTINGIQMPMAFIGLQ